MANLVSFEMCVKGTKEACRIVLETQHMAECFGTEEKNINGQNYLLISGECKGGLDAYTDENTSIDNFSIDGVNDEVMKTISNITLKAKTKLLCCEIEAFAFCDDNYVVWHGRYCNGEELVNEEIDLDEINEINFDEESYKLDCSKAFALGTDDESIKKYVGESTCRDGEESDLSNFVIEEDKLVRYCGDSGKVSIPSCVTSIAEYAFERNKNLVSIIIPNSVEYIDSYAFSGCVNLEEVIWDNPTIELGEDVFSGCKKLVKKDFVIAGTALVEYVGKDKEIVVPEYIEVIREYAFCNNLAVTKIVLGDKVRWIGERAFDGCSELKEIKVSNDVIVGRKAFGGCSSLATNNGMLVIGNTLFVYSGKDAEVEIEPCVTVIGESAFENNEYIKKVVLPSSIEKIEKNAFANCKNLVEVNIPQNIKLLGSGAFAGSGIVKIDLPNTFFEIENGYLGVFENCFALEQITIPSTLKKISYNMFKNCKRLKQVDICEGVEVIGAGAFSVCNSIETIKIPNSVVLVGREAFSSCSSLIDAEISNSETEIANDAFSDCVGRIDENGFSIIAGNLTSYQGNATDIIIPVNVKMISAYTFLGKNIKKVIIPSSVIHIGDGAFENCEELEAVVLNEGLKEIGGSAFSECKALKTIRIPGTVEKMGGVLFGESGLIDVIFDEGVTIIPDNAFSLCGNLQSVSIPESVTQIGQWAFFGCRELVKINLPKAVTELKEKTFYSCEKLEKLILPEGLIRIGRECFKDCGFKKILLPEGIEIIEREAFESCAKLSQIVLPKSLKSVAYRTFFACNKLKSIMIQEGTIELCEEAINSCKVLSDVYIPLSVTSIGKHAVIGCPKVSIHGKAKSAAQKYAKKDKINFVAE